MAIGDKAVEEVQREQASRQVNKTIEAVQALGRGEIPSNETIEKVIETAEQTLEQRQATMPLSDKGSKVVEHAKDLLETTVRAIEEKNKGEKLQSLVAQSSEVAQDISSQSTVSTYGLKSEWPSQGTLQNKASESSRAISAIARLLVRSSEFRNALSDFLGVLQDVFVREQPGQAGVAEPLRQKADASTTSSSFNSAQYMSWGDVANQTAQNTWNTTKALAKESNEEKGWAIPQEKKDELTDRLRDILRVLVRDDEFKVGMRNFISLIESVSNSAQANARQIEAKVDTTSTDKLEETAKEFIEEFTGHKSIDPFLNHSRQLINKIRNDTRLDSWVRDLKQMINDVLNNPSRVDDLSWRQSCQDLVDRARDLAYRYDYDSDWRRLNDEGRELLDAMKNDEVINELQQKGKVLASDIVYIDSHNQIHVDFESLAEVRKIVMPLIMDQLNYVPIPRMEFSDEDLDAVLDNIVLSIRDIAPDHIHIRTISDTDIRLDQLDSSTDTQIRLKMEGMRTSLTNVKFYFNRKTFPKIEDSGTVDAELGGDGAKLEIILKVNREANSPISFSGSDVNFDISELDVHFRDDVTHPILLKMWTSYMKRKLAVRAEEMVKDRVRQSVDQITAQLNALMAQLYNNMQKTWSESQKLVEEHAKEIAEGKTSSSSSSGLTSDSSTTPLLGGSQNISFGQFGSGSSSTSTSSSVPTVKSSDRFPSMF